MSSIAESPIAEPNWLEKNLDKVKIVEVDYDPASAYSIGHIPEALLID